MKIEFERNGRYRWQVVIFTKAGPIHRPHVYRLHDDVPSKFGCSPSLHDTGHYWFQLGRFMFTTM